MVDAFTRPRPGPQPQALHYSYEKAGLVLENQPVPWNAEAVIVEAQANPRGNRAQTRQDYSLKVGDDASAQVYPAESVRPGDRPDVCRIFFRIPTPARSTFAEILWKGKPLGQLTLPILQLEDFLKYLTLQLPTVSVQLDDEAVQCQTVVTTHCQNIVLSAMIASATSLAPIVDLKLRVRMLADRGGVSRETPVRFSSSQLRSRQALTAVVMPRPKRSGTWHFHWLLEDEVLAEQKLTAVTKSALERSLRVSAARYLLQCADGRLCPAAVLPNFAAGEGADVERIGPCFWVTSSLPGVAGYCQMDLAGAAKEAGVEPLCQVENVLLSDGPTPVAMGTIPRESLASIKQFELRVHGRVLGVLPLTPLPTSEFTSEGGFEPAEDFVWSAAAEEQLQQKLGRLLGGR